MKLKESGLTGHDTKFVKPELTAIPESGLGFHHF